jgi:hypothetical protein
MGGGSYLFQKKERMCKIKGARWELRMAYTFLSIHAFTFLACLRILGSGLSVSMVCFKRGPPFLLRFGALFLLLLCLLQRFCAGLQHHSSRERAIRSVTQVITCGCTEVSLLVSFPCGSATAGGIFPNKPLYVCFTAGGGGAMPLVIVLCALPGDGPTEEGRGLILACSSTVHAALGLSTVSIRSFISMKV